MPTNADLESEIARSISELLREFGILPKGYRCEVHFYRGNRKKRRDAAFKENWNPDTDSIRIGFSPMKEKVESAIAAPSKTTSAEERLADLVRALDRPEGRPGYEFVSLKWFRDTALEMIDRYALRAYDALQLAGCLVLRTIAAEAFTFVCPDQRLIEAALSEQLKALDPAA